MDNKDFEQYHPLLTKNLSRFSPNFHSLLAGREPLNGLWCLELGGWSPTENSPKLVMPRETIHHSDTMSEHSSNSPRPHRLPYHIIHFSLIYQWLQGRSTWCSWGLGVGDGMGWPRDEGANAVWAGPQSGQRKRRTGKQCRRQFHFGHSLTLSVCAGGSASWEEVNVTQQDSGSMGLLQVKEEREGGNKYNIAHIQLYFPTL